jgi:hypothetical protein
MSKGIRFFGTDYNNQAFGATVTVSSSDTKKNFMFDGLVATRWISSGEGTDGNAVSIEVDYGVNRTFDCFYIYNTNIDDITGWYWNGSSWVEITATITKSADGRYIFIKLPAAVTAQKVKLTGSNTITANQEKTVTLFYTFEEIGQFEYFPDLTPKFNTNQNQFALDDGRNFIIERGESFEADITFKSHVNQNDITLALELLARKEPFFIWPNGGDESIFTYKFPPYRFQDIYKVARVGDNTPKHTNNYYKAGMNDKFKVVEVS